MSLLLFSDNQLQQPLSGADFSNPDQDHFDGGAGESKDRRLFLANRQAVLVADVDVAQTELHFDREGFQAGDVLLLNDEHLNVIAADGALVTVTRGEQAQAHPAGAAAFSALDYADISIAPHDDSGGDESSWLRLAATREALDEVEPGVSLELGAKSYQQTLSFWRRVTVPAGTAVQTKTDLSLHIQALEHPAW